jgi:CO/xanthine dehydrogenase FAD-binding subunit
MPEPTGSRSNCENGHVMEPDWQVCPYCPGAGEAAFDETVRMPSASVASANRALDATVRVQRPGRDEASPELARTIRAKGDDDVLLPPELARTIRIDRTQAHLTTSPPAARKTEFLQRPAALTALGWLVSVAGPNRGTMHRIEGERVSVGAAAGCDAVIDSPHVSERHASIRCTGSEFVLTDLDSSNGTHVNGEAVHQHTLVDGDRVRFGSSEWVFKTVSFDEN